MAIRNRNLDKRMNYFERQFLRAQDLMDEQDYHQDRRQRLIRLMHTPGVAEGLGVAAGPNPGTITVGAGTALDANGQIIVNLTPDTVNLRTDATAAEIYISYTETPSDPSTDPGITGNTRIQETPAITQRRTAPNPEAAPPAGVLLAAVQLNSGQLIANPDNSVRSRAGTVLGDNLPPLTTSGLHLSRVGVNPAQWPGLSCVSANRLSVDGASLQLDANTEVYFEDNGQIRSLDDNHRLVFNRAANRMEFREFGDILFFTSAAAVERARISAAGNLGINTATPASLLDIQGAGGQGRGIRLGSTGTGTPETFLFPGVNNPDAGFLAFGDGSGWKFHIARHSDAGATRYLTVQDNGRVGIGDDSPYANLTVNGTIGFDNGTVPMIFMFESGTANPDRPVISHSPAFANWGLMYRDSADHMIFQQAGNPVMTIDLASSMVGVGNAAPTTRFQITHPNTAIALPNAAMNIENPTAGGQSLLSFTFAGAHRSSLRADGSGNLVLNAGSGSIFLNVDFGSPAPVLRPAGGALAVAGNLIVQGTLVAPNKSGCVTDQFVNQSGDTLEQGDVVVLGPNQASVFHGEDIPVPEVDLASSPYDTRVCGIVASVHGEVQEAEKEKPAEGKARKSAARAGTRTRMFAAHEMEKLDSSKVGAGQVGYMVTLGAYAHCKVDASAAPIEVGDLLTTSATKGHAQKAVDTAKSAGAIIGKALGSLKKGKGKIPVLVLLR
ncbi:MAG TPA: hypothetical protein VFA33_23510 [Bryobacteraceae bacterium]|nr:hypothetical protein [Bryobacteraceae bacterium]